MTGYGAFLQREAMSGWAPSMFADVEGRGAHMLEKLNSDPGETRNKPAIAVYVRSEIIRCGLTEMLRLADSDYDISVLRAIDDTGACEPACPDLVVLGCEGLEMQVVERYARRAAELGAKVLILLSERNDELFDKVVQIPSNGFLVLDELTTASLSDALRKAIAGEVVIPPPLAGRLLTSVRAGTRPRHPTMHLTPRERQALELLVEGLSNKQIARRLRISQHGAKRLVANVLAKLNCTNRTLAVAVALQQGLVDREDGVKPDIDRALTNSPRVNHI